jgi:hypothetical protein
LYSKLVSTEIENWTLAAVWGPFLRGGVNSDEASSALLTISLFADKNTREMLRLVDLVISETFDTIERRR